MLVVGVFFLKVGRADRGLHCATMLFAPKCHVASFYRVSQMNGSQVPTDSTASFSCAYLFEIGNPPFLPSCLEFRAHKKKK